ncbi:MAG TPA: PepSY domain-containing protein [Rhodospirillales bacterium]|nr:PepSY domain-containing protein [Rhodospirillales bacterium]
MRKSLLTAFASLIALSAPAIAGPSCDGTGDKLPEQQVREQYEGQGYEIRKWKVSSGGCYEFYGYENGKKVEVYIDPWTGEIVRKNEED